MSALDDIDKALRLLRDRGAEMQAFEGLLTEISGSLADIVVLMEKGTKTEAAEQPGREALDLSPVVDAIRAIRLQAPASAAPEAWKPLKVAISRDPRSGQMDGFTITKAQ